MPRYFFDIHNGKLDQDLEGIELSDASEARLQGIVTAGAMISQECQAMPSGATWQMTISDESRTIICTLRFVTDD